MIDARFVPIETWPGKERPSYEQQDSRFRVRYSDTLNDLEKELRIIHAKEIIIQAYFRRDQIRNDGWPYSGQRPAKPGVILMFRRSKAEFSFPCDKFRTFEENLRAIGLSLEALRMVDRYGVTQGHEQYQGFKRIAAPAPDAPAFGSKTSAADFLLRQAWGDPPCHTKDDIQIVIEFAENRKKIYRQAAGRLHPDAANGSHDLFIRLQEAMKILEAV